MDGENRNVGSEVQGAGLVGGGRGSTVGAELGHVVVLVGVVLVAFHVITIDERFDALLQIGRLRNKRKPQPHHQYRFFFQIKVITKVNQVRKGTKANGLDGFYQVLPSFTGFYLVILGYTGFYWALLDFTGFN